MGRKITELDRHHLSKSIQGMFFSMWNKDISVRIYIQILNDMNQLIQDEIDRLKKGEKNE